MPGVGSAGPVRPGGTSSPAAVGAPALLPKKARTGGS